jgi:hypothetical protein
MGNAQLCTPMEGVRRTPGVPVPQAGGPMVLWTMGTKAGRALPIGTGPGQTIPSGRPPLKGEGRDATHPGRASLRYHDGYSAGPSDDCWPGRRARPYRTGPY